MPTAVIAFDFDPLLRLGDGAVRWETVGVAGAILASLVVAGLAARSADLRTDDLLFVVLGIVPGAILGGRLGYLLLHPAFFLADPSRVFDPGLGSLELTLGIVGGAISGALVGALLDGRPGRWLHIAARPMLIAVAFGKLAMVLGGSGQGQPTGGEPATAYVGPGPWGSLGPAIPSIPSQAIEGLASGALLVVVMVVLLVPDLRRADGRAFLIALLGWSIVRVVVAGTWRDPEVVGPLRAEQVIALAVAIVALVLLVVIVSSRRQPGVEEPVADG